MPTFTPNNIPLVDRKSREMMTISPANTVVGSMIIADPKGDRDPMYVSANNNQHIYSRLQDGWTKTSNGSINGALVAGASGTFQRRSNTVTATGGTTTSLNTVQVSGIAKGRTIRFLTGSQAGIERTITDVQNNGTNSSKITFTPALSGAIVNTNTFVIDTGRYYVINGGTLAAGSLKNYCPLTAVWTTLSITGLPASIATDSKMVSTSNGDVYSSGTATGATATTLTSTGKTYTVNNWTNYQIRITGGTGLGQIRNIVSNTDDTVTVATWTTIPDVTSTFSIEPNEDFIYLIGNGAVTMYRYSVSSNTWVTVAPTTARSGIPVSAISADFVGLTGDPVFDNESNCLAGRYIYSFRGAGTGFIDRFDIAGGTAGAGAWANIVYNHSDEVIVNTTSTFFYGRYIYVKIGQTNRFFRFDIPSNFMEGISTFLYGDGTPVLGNRIFVLSYKESGVEKMKWLYNQRQTGNEIFRLPLF